MNVKILLLALGVDIFEVVSIPQRSPKGEVGSSSSASGGTTTEDPKVAPGESPLFEIRSPKVNAQATIVDGQLIVLQRSQSRGNIDSSMGSYKNLREQLMRTGVLTIDSISGLYTFTRDYPFSSPSAAAAVVLGRNSNGRIEWKTQPGKQTYAEWEASKLTRST